MTAGYVAARQAMDGRSASLNVVGLAPPTTLGAVTDELALYGTVIGAWAGYSLDTDVPVQLRLGAGGFLGSIHDHRRGTFTAHDGSTVAVGTVSEARSAHSIYIAPELRVGLPLGPRVQLSAGLEVPILIGVSKPRWSTSHAINVDSDGYGWFDADALKGAALVGLVPTVGGRFDL